MICIEIIGIDTANIFRRRPHTRVDCTRNLTEWKTFPSRWFVTDGLVLTLARVAGVFGRVAYRGTGGGRNS